MTNIRFKLGDRVKVVRGRKESEADWKAPLDAVGTIRVVRKGCLLTYGIEFDQEMGGHDLDGILGAGSKRGQYLPEDSVELVGKSRKKKVVPEVLHIVLKDSCKNVCGNVKLNYEDARTYTPSDSESYTIYKLVPVAKVQKVTSVVVKRLKSK